MKSVAPFSVRIDPLSVSLWREKNVTMPFTVTTTSPPQRPIPPEIEARLDEQIQTYQDAHPYWRENARQQAELSVLILNYLYDEKTGLNMSFSEKDIQQLSEKKFKTCQEAT